MLSQSARLNIAKPTTNTEHAFIINTFWYEKEYGIAEGKNQDYCMGREGQETSEDSKNFYKSESASTIMEANDGLTLLAAPFIF